MIVITGGNGFIGSNLALYLVNLGYNNIRIVDYVERSYNIGISSISYTPAEDFYKNLNMYDIDYIFHEGAISSTTETNIEKIYTYNTECSVNLLYYCNKNQIPIQYASSASVYGNLDKAKWLEKNKQVAPLNLYAKSKAIIDSTAENIIKFNNKTKIQGMRYFNVYGPNEDHKIGQSSPHFAFSKQIEETGKIKLFEGSENFYRDFVSVDEVIKYKLLCFNYCNSGIYDVGSASPKSFYDVAVEICNKYNMNPATTISYIPMPDNIKEHYQQYSCSNMDWTIVT